MIPTLTKNKAFTKSVSVSAKNGVLKNIRVKSKSGSAIFIHYFDSAVPVVNGAVPSSAPVPVPATGYYESDTEFHFKKGLQICASSTESALTLIGADDVWFTAHYEK